MKTSNLNGYELSRAWFDFSFENPELISPNHAAIYFFAIEHCNRLGWKKKFGFPTQMAMDAVGIKKHETYIRYFNDLVKWGFFNLIQKSTNQYSSNIISLMDALPKNGKALGKAILTHEGKQTQPIGESNRSIDKPLTIKPETFKPNYEFNSLFAKILNKKYEAGPDRGMTGIGQDVDSLVIQMRNMKMNDDQIMGQAKAMRAYYELKDWPMPTNFIKLLEGLTENDWTQKLKDEDPEKKSERIQKTLKNATRKQPEPDLIGSSAPGSLG